LRAYAAFGLTLAIAQPRLLRPLGQLTKRLEVPPIRPSYLAFYGEH
jgi:hypothetical protein